MSERQEELVNKHPEEDEEDAKEDKRGGEGGPQVIRVLKQQGEVDDKIETGCQQADDDQHVEDQPGKEEHAHGGAHSNDEKDGGEEAKNSQCKADGKETRCERERRLFLQLEGPLDGLHGVHLLHLGPRLLLRVLQDKPGS